MSNMTGAEQFVRQKELENGAASALGFMLMEFARLDMNLGLCLVWVDGGAELDRLTKAVSEMSLKAKLDALAGHVASKLPAGSKRHAAYTAWLERSHKIRRWRNDLVHGRWGIDPHKGVVFNVIGLPTSPDQHSIEYSLEQLQAITDELASLQVELSRLRDHWPL